MKPSANPSPTVHALFEEAKRRGLRDGEISDMIRHSLTSVKYWKRYRRMPIISAVEAFADALDMEIKVVPKRAVDRIGKGTP